jgi:drug/metabolite transporter (DMT)-like permease
MKTYVVLALAILAQATGNVCLSKAMKEFFSDGSILVLFSQALRSPTLWLGTFLYILFFVLFTAVLSWEDLSFVVPAISAEVIVNVAFADFFLKEPVSSVRWLGSILVSIGVILVLSTRKQSVRSDSESAGRR